MLLNDYQAAALRTANPKADKSLRLAVAGMGLAGEAAEVLELVWLGGSDQNKLIKELGDQAWYCAETASIAGLALGDIPLPPKRAFGGMLSFAVQLSINAGEITDYLKKVVGHSHPMELERIQIGLGSVIRSVIDLAEYAGTDLETVCSRNVEKLMARYPTGFSTEGSVNRTE